MRPERNALPVSQPSTSRPWAAWYHLIMRALSLALVLSATPFAEEGPATFSLTSPAFQSMQQIPSAHTCEGQDISPPLAWTGAPPGTKSLVLIVDDPDAPDPKAPQTTWVHWVLYNIPPASTGLPAAVASRSLPAGTHEGLNDWGRTGYGGPCPPVGRHRYFFKLYALDTVLPDLGKPTKTRLESAMQSHVLGKAQLLGTYEKNH